MHQLFVFPGTFWTAVVTVAAVATAIHANASQSQRNGAIQFENVWASENGFRLENSPSEWKHLPETMAGGVAVLDYDSDGRPDIFFANGAELPSSEKKDRRFWNRLYRNVGGLRFQDVTETAGLQGAGYSMGVSAGDFDNDGHGDLFVTGLRHNMLYRNRGNGTFEDVTVKAGIGREEWSAGAAWFDYDRDGLLDLFVVNYVQWSDRFDQFCGDQDREVRVYCHPKLFKGTGNQLYRNLGNGRFQDVSASSGISAHTGKGMAAAVADYDADGFPDLFVTNDKIPNFLFHNLRNGRFEEVALQAGVALPDTGADVSSMGVDFRDVNNDGLPDIIVTALAGETFPLFRNVGKLQFRDATYASQMGSSSRRYSGWGIGVVDLDNDGWKDIFTANSHVNDRVEAFEATTYRQANSVFRNAGAGRFEDVSKQAGLEIANGIRAHRGCAFGDFDGDGRVDVVTSSLGDSPELWHNLSPGGQTWLELKLIGVRSNRDGIGAVVQLAGQTNAMTTSVGYGSTSDTGVHFGTGQAKEVDPVEILWPSGIRQVLRHVRTNQILLVREKADSH